MCVCVCACSVVPLTAVKLVELRHGHLMAALTAMSLMFHRNDAAKRLKIDVRLLVESAH